MSQSDAMSHAREVQARAADMGFDWPDAHGVLDKILEEAGEIREALDAGDQAHAREELGDLLLAAVHLSRFLDAQPREALARATERFEKRFAMVAQAARDEGLDMRQASLDELDQLWESAKKRIQNGCGEAL